MKKKLNLKTFYRFRSVESLIGDKYKELEKQSVYFPHPDQLNDPMEGYRDIYWKGDLVIWKNLFKHYLFCLESLCNRLLFVGEDHLISKSDMPIFSGEDELPTDQYKDLFSQISGSFFGNQKFSDLLNAISSRSTLIRRDELHFYLSAVHLLALETIYSAYENAGLISPRRKRNLSPDDTIKNLLESDFIGTLEKSLNGIDSEGEMAGNLFSIQKHLRDQADIIRQYNGRNDNNKKNQDLIFYEFPKEYVTRLEELVFPGWYTACFMSECSNSSVWGHYGDSHKGVCLMFRSELINDIHCLSLKGMNGWGSSGATYGYGKHRFHPIDYIKGVGQIDFFRSLGRLPRPILNQVWYCHDGVMSECAECFANSEDKWRRKYWERFYRDIVIKSKDWEYENEYRLILSDGLVDYSDKKNRTLTYDFNSLEGLIFGMNTENKDKIRVIEIIEEKCKEHGRSDFKFYQAYYSPKKKCIKYSEMNLLNFGVN